MSENSACCGCTAGESMEDMPMCRYSNPIPTCEHKRGCGSRGGRCSCEEELEQILMKLDSDTFYIYHIATVMVDNLRGFLLGVNLPNKAVMYLDFAGIGCLV